MFQTILLSLCLLATAYGATFDEAETALTALKEASSNNLNGAFLEHTKMSVEIDSAAYTTKGVGSISLQKTLQSGGRSKSVKCQSILAAVEQVTADDLDTCVNTAADAAIDIVHTRGIDFSDVVLSAAYDLERRVVVCGQSDEDCLDGVVADILAQLDALPDSVNDEVETSRQAVEAQIEVITACGAAVGKKAKELIKIFNDC